MTAITLRGMAELRARLAEYREQAPEALDLAMDDTADAISLAAQRLVPVDTGFLRSSINVRRRPLRKSIGTNADYAERIEFGTPTGTGPHGGPRPYLRPAFVTEVRRLVEFFKRHLTRLG
jgi:hypothetical protein